MIRHWLAALTPIIAAIVALITASNLGFPDGHLTEHERALRPLLRALTAAGFLGGGSLVGLILTGRRRGILPVLVATVLVMAGIGAWIAFGLSGLDSGQGG
jgi:hypothetical protein